MRFYLNVFLLAAVILFLFASGCSKDSGQSIEQCLKTAAKQLQNGELAKAEENAQKTMNLIEQQRSMVHPGLAKPLNILAIIYQKQGKISKAEQNYERAISILQSSEGGNNLVVSQLMINQAGMYYAEQKYERAIDVFEQSLSIVRSHFSEADPRVQAIKRNIKTCKSALQGGQPTGDLASVGNIIGGTVNNDVSQFQREGQASVGGTDAQASRPPPQDLLPDKVKQTVLNQLAKQNIHLYNLRPMNPVKIGAQGAVLPYRCKQKAAAKDKGDIEAVLLFATVKNDETGGFIFKQCRMVSYDSYMEEVKSGNQTALVNALKEVFPKVYS